VDVKDTDGTVLVSISDTGIGIAEEDIPKLEKSFSCTQCQEEGIKGTGLGLSIVTQLVDHFAGTMDVRSKLGEGTTFTIRLQKTTLIRSSTASLYRSISLWDNGGTNLILSCHLKFPD
jgi:two-component system phosphate regulon sensor histidine kinase PhoR